MNSIQVGVAFIGRIFLSGIFFLSAILEIINWTEVEQYVIEKLHNWANVYDADMIISDRIAQFFPWLPWVLLVSLGFKLLGSVMVMLGWRVRFGAVVLLCFVIPATLVTHDFWHKSGEDGIKELVMFLKNMSIIGGLLILIAFGKGSSQQNSSKA